MINTIHLIESIGDPTSPQQQEFSCGGLPMRLRLKNKFREQMNESCIQRSILSTPPLLPGKDSCIEDGSHRCANEDGIPKQITILPKDIDAAASLASLSSLKLSSLDKMREQNYVPPKSKSESFGNSSSLETAECKNAAFVEVDAFKREISSIISNDVHAQSKKSPVETTNSKAYLLTFPQKLMKILDNEEIVDIISWLPCGIVFVIKNRHSFTREVMPQYFEQVKYTSFTRKLHRWGFRRHGIDDGAYSHQKFKRGKFSLCAKMRMVRQVVKDHVKVKPIIKKSSEAQALRDMESGILFSRQSSCPSLKHDNRRLQPFQPLLSSAAAKILMLEQKIKNVDENLDATRRKNRNIAFINEGANMCNTQRYEQLSFALRSNQGVYEAHKSLKINKIDISNYSASVINEAIYALKRSEEKMAINSCHVRESRDISLLNNTRILGYDMYNFEDHNILSTTFLSTANQNFMQCYLNNFLLRTEDYPFFRGSLSDTMFPAKSVKMPPAA